MSYRGTFTTEYLYCDKCCKAVADALTCYHDVHVGMKVVQGFFKDSSHSEGMQMFLNECADIKLCEGHKAFLAVFWEGDGVRIISLGQSTLLTLSDL